MGFHGSVCGRPILDSTIAKPDHNDDAAFARWLVSLNTWGVINTIASDLDGAPFGNVASYSDGLPNEGTGIPYFYLSPLDPTPRYGLKDPRASFTVSEYPLGTCGRKDPENPSCSKITLIGKFKLIDGNSKEFEYAKSVLFAKHPEMQGWPKDHKFQVFSLEIQDIFLINWYGGSKPLTVDEYLHPKENKFADILQTPI